MGEPVTVIEKPSNRTGFVRFETNRSFTGMGHERYEAGEEIFGDRPPDEIARRLFETKKVDEVHVYGQAITVKLFRRGRQFGSGRNHRGPVHPLPARSRGADAGVVRR